MRKCTLLAIAIVSVAADAFGGLDGSGVAWGNMTFFLPAMNARLEAVSRAMHYNGTFPSNSDAACYGLYSDLASAVPLNESRAARANQTLVLECIKPLAKYHVAQGRWSGLLYPANDTIALIPTLLERETADLTEESGGSSSATYSARPYSSKHSAMSSATYSSEYSSQSNAAPYTETVVETATGLFAAARRAFKQATGTFETASYESPTGTYESHTPTATYAPLDYAVLVVNATANMTTVQGGGNSTAAVLAGYSFLWGQIYVIDEVLVPPMPLNDTLASLGYDPTLNATGWRDLSSDITAFYSESGGNTTVCVGEAVFVNRTTGTADLSTENGESATLDASDMHSARFNDTPIVRANIPLANGVLHLVA